LLRFFRLFRRIFQAHQVGQVCSFLLRKKTS